MVSVCQIPPGPPFSKGGAVTSPLFQRGEQLLVGLGPAQPGGALTSNLVLSFRF
jgi:hypothetical protein